MHLGAHFQMPLEELPEGCGQTTELYQQKCSFLKLPLHVAVFDLVLQKFRRFGEGSSVGRPLRCETVALSRAANNSIRPPWRFHGLKLLHLIERRSIMGFPRLQ